MVVKRVLSGALAALSALALAGCEVYAVPNPVNCTGTRIGTFNFAGDEILPIVPPPTGKGCFFADPTNSANQVLQSIGFTGSIYFGEPATPQVAAICINAPHAVPRVGDVASDGTITVTYRNVGTTINGCTCPSPAAVTAGRCACPTSTPTTNCSCPVIVTETIQGVLTHAPGAVLTGFVGTQVDAVTPPPDVVADAPCDCQVACNFSYDVAATLVGAP